MAFWIFHSVMGTNVTSNSGIHDSLEKRSKNNLDLLYNLTHNNPIVFSHRWVMLAWGNCSAKSRPLTYGNAATCSSRFVHRACSGVFSTWKIDSAAEPNQTHLQGFASTKSSNALRGMKMPVSLAKRRKSIRTRYTSRSWPQYPMSLNTSCSWASFCAALTFTGSCSL